MDQACPWSPRGFSTTTRLELFKETVHDKVKMTSSEPSWSLKARSQDPGREGHASRSAASDVASKRLEVDRAVLGVQCPEEVQCPEGKLVSGV